MTELADILQDQIFNKTFNTVSDLGNTLSRVEIEGILVANGASIPPDYKTIFFIRDPVRAFFVAYSKDSDKYWYERLNEAI